MITLSVLDTRHEFVENGKLWIHAMHNRTRNVVGVASLEVVPDDSMVWLNDLYVDPLHRGRGIATRLVECAVFEWKRQRMVPEDWRLDAAVSANNVASAAVMQKCGFVRLPLGDFLKDGVAVHWWHHPDLISEEAKP